MHHDEAHKGDKENYPPFYKNPREADAELTKTYVDAMKDWAQKKAKNDGSYNEEERKRAEADFEAMLSHLPADRRQAVLNKMAVDMAKYYKEHPDQKPKPEKK